MSSFYTSLSGLNAAQTDLNVSSNNIANAGTTGFKQSRADFGDVISSSVYQAQNTVIGQGTRLKAISQEFDQGSAQTTNNALDLMVSGDGFFVTKSAGSNSQVTYTRDGSFSLDNNNNAVDSSGNALQVLPVDSLGNVTATGTAALSSLHVPATTGTPLATSAINVSATFPSDADIPADRATYSSSNPYAFSATDTNSYNSATSTTVYDSAGDAIPAVVYYVRDTQPATDGSSTTSTWTAHMMVGDQEVYPSGTSTAATLTFDANGTLTSPTSAIAYSSVTPTGAVAPLTLSLNFGTATKQGAYAFSSTSSQNGTTTGKRDNLTVGKDGLVSASYSDGSTLALGKVALATFTNPNGLHQDGNTSWSATGLSGAPQISAANTDGKGEIDSGELEMSNVDLTAELVNLIQAQRDFQANAKAIDTDKQMLESVININ